MHHFVLVLCIFLSSIIYYLGSITPVSAQTSADWYMPAANPQRTSWVSEEIRGNLNVEWYQAVEPYIPYNFQPVFYNDRAYVATAKGLYAFNLTAGYSNGTNGRVEWVYPTDMPYGNSPTIVGNTLYIPSLDHTIHALNLTTHQPLSSYTPYPAGAGFSTNPLVVGNVIYAGNRDGYFYALNATTGALIWRYQTGDAILFSAAYKDNTVYFASNDLYAYALNTIDGSLKWRTGPFPTAGFFSYWPVIYTEKVSGVDYVIFTFADNYRQQDSHTDEVSFLLPCIQNSTTPCPLYGSTNNIIFPVSTAPANNYFPPGTSLLDVGNVSNYYEPNNYPQHRALYILETQLGKEYTFDSDGDGLLEYAPLTWSNRTNSGTKHPPVINHLDQTLYSTLMYNYNPGNSIPRGNPVGWQFGSHSVSLVANGTYAVDEPLAYSSGGKMLYYALMGERSAGAFDLSIPAGTPNRSWLYFDYSLAKTVAPDYQVMYHNGDENFYNNDAGWNMYGGKIQSRNGIYSKHMTAQSPPIPYKGKLYFLKSNALLAFTPGTPTRTMMPWVGITPVPSAAPPAQNLTQKLDAEVQKMITAGHLRPGYFSSGFYDPLGQGRKPEYDFEMGEIWDYFQNPAETVVTLTQALPHLSAARQTEVKNYLTQYYGPGSGYDLTQYVHIGWNTGAKREYTEIPATVQSIYTNFPKSTTPRCSRDRCGWANYPPYSFYGAWKYVQSLGGTDPQTLARDVLSRLGYNTTTHTASKLESPAGFLADAFSVYVNGQNINTTSLGGIGIPADDSAAPLYLGGNAANNYDGTLDEVKIFNQALTPTQVLSAAEQSTCPTNSPSCIVPVGYWKLDENTGTVAHNSSALGSVLDGSLSTGTSSATWTNPGKYGSALNTDGVDDVVTVNPHPDINLLGKNNTGYSVCTWVKPETGGEGGRGHILSKGNSYLRVLGYNASLNIIRVSALFDLTGYDASYEIIYPLPVNNWSHVCVVWQNDTVLAKPYILNQYLAGYLGFLELQKLANYPENSSIRNTYNQLLNTRISMFNKDTPHPRFRGTSYAYNYADALSISRNFMYLVPELAAYFREHALTQFSEALNEYQYVAPYWYIGKFDATIGEATLHHLYDSPSIFQAKAYLTKSSQSELIKYLDIPSFAVGDLFYIQNLVAAIEADPNPPPPPTVDYPAILNFLQNFTNIFDFNILIRSL